MLWQVRKASNDAMSQMNEAKRQEHLLWWENLGDVLERVATERAEDNTTVAHFAQEATMRQVAEKGVSKGAKYWAENETIPDPPDIGADKTLLDAISFAQFACLLVTELSSQPKSGVTKVCIPYFVGLPGMKQLQSGGFEETLINGLVALTFRVLQVCAPEEAKWLELKIMRHKADVREIEGAQWFSKACPSERFATVLYNDSIGPKCKKKRLYCYRGGGALDYHAAAVAGGIVCLCKQWELVAALHCALKLGMCCCPFGPVSNAEPSLCYSVEYVERNCLDEDEDDHVGEPTTSMGVEDFRGLCKEYFEKCSKIANIVPYDDGFGKPLLWRQEAAQAAAGLAGTNAQSLLRWWQDLAGVGAGH